MDTLKATAGTVALHKLSFVKHIEIISQRERF